MNLLKDLQALLEESAPAVEDNPLKQAPGKTTVTLPTYVWGFNTAMVTNRDYKLWRNAKGLDRYRIAIQYFQLAHAKGQNDYYSWQGELEKKKGQKAFDRIKTAISRINIEIPEYRVTLEGKDFIQDDINKFNPEIYRKLLPVFSYGYEKHVEQMDRLIGLIGQYYYLQGALA